MNGMGGFRPQMPRWDGREWQRQREFMRDLPKFRKEREDAFAAMAERNRKFRARNGRWSDCIGIIFTYSVIALTIIYGGFPIMRKEINTAVKEAVVKTMEVAKNPKSLVFELEDMVDELNPLKKKVYVEIDPISGFINQPVNATGREINKKHGNVDILYFFPVKGQPIKHPNLSRLIVVQKSVFEDPGQAGSNIRGMLEQTGYRAKYGRLSLLSRGPEYAVADTTIFSHGESTAGYVNALLRNQKVVILDNFPK